MTTRLGLHHHLFSKFPARSLFISTKKGLCISRPLYRYSNRVIKGFYMHHVNLGKDLKFFIRKVKDIEVYVENDTIDLLCKTFELSTSEVLSIVKYPKLRSCNKLEIHNTIDYLYHNDITRNVLNMAPWLLWLNSVELKKRRNLIDECNLFENSSHGVGFLFYPQHLIVRYKILMDSEKYKFCLHRNRIYYICEKLKLPVQQFTLKAVLVWKIFHGSKEKIDKVIDLLKEFNMEPKNILNDLHIFTHNKCLKTDRERFIYLSDFNTVALKPWVGRCTTKDFNAHYFKLRTNAFEKQEDFYQLVASEIDYDVQSVKSFFSKFIDRYVSPNKVVRNLETLKNLGFSNQQISVQCISCTNLIWEGDVHLKCLFHRRCISSSKLTWNPAGCFECRNMGATSVALDSQFAGAICNAIIGWREQNNLPTKDGVDIPMPRPPKGERDNLIILRCSTETIKRRMQLLEDVSLNPKNILYRPSTYLLSNNKEFQEIVLKQKVANLINLELQHKKQGTSLFKTSEEFYSFVAAQLECDIEDISNFYATQLRKTSSTKIMQNLTVLKKLGFSNIQIRKNLHALNATTGVIIERTKILEQISLKPSHIQLSYFTRSRREFSRILSNYSSKNLEE